MEYLFVDSPCKSRQLKEDIDELNSKIRSHAARVTSRARAKDAALVKTGARGKRLVPKPTPPTGVKGHHSAEDPRQENAPSLKWRTFRVPGPRTKIKLAFRKDLSMNVSAGIIPEDENQRHANVKLETGESIPQLLSIVPHEFPGELKQSVQFCR